jgi:5-methylcytosine-specific restriction endonuclease McrA
MPEQMVSQPIVTRKEAKERGLKQFYTGEPCKSGHVVTRITINGQCLECNRLKNREWYLSNQDAKREYDRKRLDANPDVHKDRCRKYRQANPIDVTANRARAFAWGRNNAERNRERAREWGRANPEELYANVRNRRAREMAADGKHTAADIRRLRDEQGNRCGVCSSDLAITGTHIDHMTPLIRGGSNDVSNLMLLCPPCNMSKHTKTFEEFMAARGAAF